VSDVPATRSLTDLTFEVRRTADRIRTDIKRGRIQANKIGRDWRFTAEQWRAAVLFYGLLDAAQLPRSADDGA
jgi:hypothetical protein